MVFTPVGEVQSTSVVPWAMAEKAAKDFFKEEWVEEPGITMFLEGLEEEVVLTDRVVVEEAAEATLEEVAEKINLTPGGGGGGSYNAGKNQQNECCYNTAGHGQVIITLI